MKFDDGVKNRIKRTEGQIRGILKMMEEEKDCRDVVTQLSAVRAAIDKAIGMIVSENLVSCVVNGQGNEEEAEKLIQDAVNLLVKSR